MASFFWNLGRHWRILPRVARRFITVAETPLFSRQAREVWDDAELAAFIDFIARNPEEGDLIPETGGVRKIRWARPGSGKRGKARQENLTAEEKKAVRKLAAILKVE
jgi:hypothetical protein